MGPGDSGKGVKLNTNSQLSIIQNSWEDEMSGKGNDQIQSTIKTKLNTEF